MATVIIKDNEIWAKFDVTDIKRIRVCRQGEIKQVFVQMYNGAVFEADPEFYVYCLNRMSELNIFIDIETTIWVGNLDPKHINIFR